MARTQWNPDPRPFGNAKGLDYVSLDVYVCIAERCGATVLTGELPADIAAEQPARLAAARKQYGDRMTAHSGEAPFAKFTISHDGGTLSGEHADGKGHTSGYRGHYWADRIGPDTVVVDLRTVPDSVIVAFAVRGPMVDVTLPAGTVSRLEGIPAHMAAVADSYLAPYGGIAETGAEVVS